MLLNKETKHKVYKYYVYYELWVDVNRQRNKAIYLLFINAQIKKCDLSKMFNLSKTRITQIINKQQRINDSSKEIKKQRLNLWRNPKDTEKKIKSVINYYDMYVKETKKNLKKGIEERNLLTLKLKNLREGQVAK
tara:strand:+ start:462 stop:866 length:405 start_codon:yes stop_codon:yes gene_type:complete